MSSPREPSGGGQGSKHVLPRTANTVYPAFLQLQLAILLTNEEHLASYCLPVCVGAHYPQSRVLGSCISQPLRVLFLYLDMAISWH
jgi:hypothetical protein